MSTKILFNDNFYVCEGNLVGKDSLAYKSVKIPHDFAITQAIGENFPDGRRQGFVDCYHKITYKKIFNYIKKDGEKAYISFDGVFRNSEVYVNGNLAGIRPYGYVQFSYDITKYLVDGDNLLEVFVDNSVPPADRWYSGMGIYRDVQFITTSEIHVAEYGTYITTPNITAEKADVHIQFELEKDYECEATLDVDITFNGEVVANGKFTSSDKFIETDFVVVNPKLWDLTHANMYKAVAKVYVDEKLMDTHESSFGIREIIFDGQKGMFLNGESVKLKGVNLHHDTGCIGSAFLKDAWIRKIQSLKDIGVNAIRCSHNPQAKTFYELCDEMGIFVYDEAFDKWYWKLGYTKEYFDDWWKEDIMSMIRRDRNHPCVFLWSVGNEVELQGTDEMIALVERHVAFAKEFEPTRPISFAMMPHCNPAEDGNDFGVRAYTKGVPHIVGLTEQMNKTTDIMSCNYQEQWYEEYRKVMPEKLIIGTETYQYYTATKGKKYFNDLVEIHPYSYVKENDFVIGMFYWPGVDYLGECHEYPARVRGGNLIDIAGFERPFAGHSKALFTDKNDYLDYAVFDEKQDFEYLSSAWSYPLCTHHMMIDRHMGQIVRLATYTTCESVEITIGARCYGERFLKDYRDNMITWSVGWDTEPVVIVGKNNGVEVARKVIMPFGEVADFDIKVDKTTLTQDTHNLSFVEIRSIDKDGMWNENAKTEITIAHNDTLELMGIDNGNATSHHDYKGKKINLYHGKAVVIMRANAVGTGKLRIRNEELNIEKIVEIECV
ncbi:MAG: glycoside hydrolase family 2 TIM barrel-domain containing protein [Clostridia bacterium]